MCRPSVISSIHAPSINLLTLIKKYLYFERSQNAIKALDGLRGLAILLVLGRHASNEFNQKETPVFPLGHWDVATPFFNGWVGVDLFFVLSGFLITLHLLKQFNQNEGQIDLKPYFLKRILRIVPAYYGFLIIVSFGWIPFYEVPSEHLSLRILYHLLFLQDYLGANIVVAFWSLGVEEKFYIFAPLMFLLCWKCVNSTKLFLFLGLLISVSIIGRWMTFVAHQEISTYEQFFFLLRSPTHLSLDSLIVGTIVAFIFWRLTQLQENRSPRIWAKPVFWCGACLISVLIFQYPILSKINLFTSVAIPLFLGIGFGAMVLALSINPELYGKVFQSKFLFFFSKISYSLYLVHMVFLGSTMMLLKQIVDVENFPLGIQFLLYFPLFCVISIIGALLLHYLIEKPFLLIKERY